MAKRRKGRKGKRRGRKGGKKKGHKSSKQSLALAGSAAWDGYVFLSSGDGSGRTNAGTLMKAPFDKGSRDFLLNNIKGGGLKTQLVDSTRHVQLVAGIKILQKVPVIKGPVNMAVNAVNSLGRQFGIKGRYKVI